MRSLQSTCSSHHFVSLNHARNPNSTLTRRSNFKSPFLKSLYPSLKMRLSYQFTSKGRMHRIRRGLHISCATSSGVSTSGQGTNGSTNSGQTIRKKPPSQNGYTSQMVPIEEALVQVRKEKKAVNENNSPTLNGGSNPNGSTIVVSNREKKNEITKQNSNNGSISRISEGNSSRPNGTTYVDSNGASNGTVQKFPSIGIKEGSIDSSAEFGATIPSSNGRLSSEDDLKVLPLDDSFRWAQDDYNITRRNIDVWSFVLTLRARIYLLDAKWTYIGGFSEEKKKKRVRSLASWVRESILELGPTFIKLGQLSSTRSDFLPQEFVEELSKLQDRVPAFTAEKAIAMIERELGAPINQLFAKFERRPIAAASLGQVHRAVLYNGETVVVKVQRPGLKELFDIDLGNMKIVAEFFQKSETLGGPTRDWVGIYQECSTILYQEIDYLNEGRNADRFRKDFRKYPWVKVPKVYWDYASRKILTLEYVPGIKINNVSEFDRIGLNRALIAQRAIEAYLIQILKTGFFHADPHPGNLAVDNDNSLIYYDFGMMGEIKSFTKSRLLDTFYAVYEKDAKKVIAAMVDLGALVPTGDMTSVRRSIQFFLDNLTGPKVDEKNTISAIGEDLFSIAVDQPFRFPATFTFVLRAFSTLEGIGKILDSDFSFPKIAAPYAQELLDIRDSKRGQDFLVQRLQQQATEVRDATVSMPIRVERMDAIISQLEAGDLKLRVRVLEAERSARRTGILQIATMNTVVSASLLNVGVTLSTNGASAPATLAFVSAGIFGAFVIFGMKRVQRLDKFEKMI